MKATGIVRRTDDLGRVVIPMETRKILGIGEGCPLEIYTENDLIILKKYAPGCAVCGDMTDLVTVGPVTLCPGCVGKFGKVKETPEVK